MARNISFQQAINEALAQEMERDETVVLFGEDVVGGSGAPGDDDAWGGVLGITKGLYPKFPNRVLDTPISESAIMGAAAGAASSGLRQVAELMFVDFLGVCLDHIARRVTDGGFVEQSDLDAIDRAVATLIDEAVAEAKAAPDPTPADVLTDVYVTY